MRVRSHHILHIHRHSRIFAVFLLLLAVGHAHAGPINSGQPRDADLTQISALICVDGQIMKRATGVWTCAADAGAGGGAEPSDGDKTDITVAGGTVWTIDTNAVTNTKLADMANATFKCRNTAGTGDPEDCTITQVTTLLDPQLATQAELNAFAVANDSVTNAKLANMASGTFKGRATGGTGDPEDLTTTDVVTLLDTQLATQAELDGLVPDTAHALDLDPTDCGANQFATAIAANGNLTCTSPSDAAIPNSITIDLAATATALAADPADCSAGNFPLGIAASGAVQSCTDAATQAELNTFSTTLSTTGTINLGGNPVDWSRLKNVPAGFADGADDGAGGGGVSDGDKSDITVSSTGAIWTIDNNAVTDAKVVDTITASNYLPLVGGTLTGLLTLDNLGLAFDITAPTPDCEEGDYHIYATEGGFNKCVNGEPSSLDTDTDTGATTLQEAYEGGKTIVGADSEANAFIVCTDNSAPQDDDCTDATDSGWKLWSDPAIGPQMKAFPNSNYNITAADPFDISFRLGAEVARFDHTTGKLLYFNDGRPLKSVTAPGYEFGGCSYTEAAIAANRPVLGLLTCGDNDNDGFDFDFVMPLNWNASTVTVRLSALSVHANPAGNVVLTCSGQAVSDGDVIVTRASTGEQSITLGLAAQYREEMATSAAITLTGSPTAGDHIYMHCDVDATATNVTGGTMADVRIYPVAKVFYTVISESE